MNVHPVLINGAWNVSTGAQSFHAVNPQTRAALARRFPVSPWEEIERAVQAAARAAELTRDWPGARFARFLERYATRIEGRAAELVAAAHEETALPAEGRLAKAELPRTVNQLRQAAAAALDGSWANPVIDTAANIRSMLAPIGPVCVFGPNNFPFAFNSIAGGDFAAAVAAGNPVIAKGHSSHPETTRLFAVEADAAARETELPPGFVQLLYRTDHADGERLVAHRLIGATGYTGAREAGLRLKAAADHAGKPIYLELSSINPVFVLPGALAERSAALADEFAASCLMGAGQFCTNPGLVVVPAGAAAEAFFELVRNRFESAPVAALLGEGVLRNLERGVESLRAAGAEAATGAAAAAGSGYCYRNTLLRVSGERFLAVPAALQAEAFGNCSLFVFARDSAQMRQIAQALEGNLTGAIYSATTGGDDAAYAEIAPELRQHVGRLLNDKMPTGVAVSPAMNHGGPFPATGHPGFTAVGIPAAQRRFAMLQCYDSVRPHRLPPALQNQNPTGTMWRQIDGRWTQGHAG